MKLHMFVVRRLILLLPVIVGVTILTFTISHLIPADAAAAQCGDKCGIVVGYTDDGDPITAYEEQRERLGMNEPLIIRFRVYVAHLYEGDWVGSRPYHRPVANVVNDAAPIP